MTKRDAAGLWVKGEPSPNPKGRPPGPTAPTLILKDAYLMAAKIAGGGGDDGLVNYLVDQAKQHPVAFLAGLNRIIPMQVEARGSGTIVVEIIERFDDDHPAPKLINGYANRNGHDSGNGSDDPAAE